MNDKLNRLRDWIAGDDERRERERELPRAQCRVCGGWAKVGEGSRDAEPFRGLAPHPADPSRRVLVSPPKAPADADDWRRTCAACVVATPGEIVSAVVGHTVDTNDANRVFGRMRNFDLNDVLVVEFPTAQTAGRGTGRPWGHLRAEDRRRVRNVLREVVDDRRPGISKWGACGLCGRRESLRWCEGPNFLRWPDGSPAPVCAECQRVVDRRPEADSMEQLRVIGVEIATGFAQMYYRAPDEFRLYAETKDCDGNGHALAWDYGDGIREFQEEMWADRPNLAPEDRRDEFAQRLRERVAEAKREAQQQAETEHASAW